MKLERYRVPSRFIAVAMTALAVLVFALGGCAHEEPAPVVENPILVLRVTAAFDQARLDAERIEQEHAEAIKHKRERAKFERAAISRIVQKRVKQKRAEAEAARLAQERADFWRNRFPPGKYSDTLLLGDSLMQNATSALTAAMPGVVINADSGRTLETGGLVFENQSPDAGILDHVRADKGEYARYVIGTGNNDYAGMPLSAAEEIIAHLGSSKEIYFITEMVTGNVNGTNATNATIADVVSRYPNVHAIDWHGLVKGHETEYLIDGCHVRAEHLADYAAFIKDAIDEPR